MYPDFDNPTCLCCEYFDDCMDGDIPDCPYDVEPPY